MRLPRAFQAAVILIVVVLPTVASSQWVSPSASTIATDCGTPPCKVQINPGNPSNYGIALDAGGDIIATGGSTDVGAISTAGPAAVFAAAPPNEVSAVLLRTGSSEAVHLRREATSNDFTIFTSNLERLRITAAGRIGIGTNPTQALEVNGHTLASSFAVGGPVPPGYQFFATTAATGIGTALQFRSSYTGSPAVSFIGNYGNFGTYISQNRDPQSGVFVAGAVAPNELNAAQLVIGDVTRGGLLQLMNFPGGLENVRLFVGYDGKVGIGTATPTQLLDVQGNINVAGNINAKYQDVAEWVEAPTRFEAGTVVVLDPSRNNAVIASAKAYDTTAAGVISAQPGISLGEPSDTKVLVATTGRVRVKVDASRGAIRIGDLLVTSAVPGTAMKSEPVHVAGIDLHRPGTLIGKALEPLASGQGEILVLLSLQ